MKKKITFYDFECPGCHLTYVSSFRKFRCLCGTKARRKGVNEKMTGNVR